jgi:hypothetical protein
MPKPTAQPINKPIRISSIYLKPRCAVDETIDAPEYQFPAIVLSKFPKPASNQPADIRNFHRLIPPQVHGPSDNLQAPRVGAEGNGIVLGLQYRRHISLSDRLTVSAKNRSRWWILRFFRIHPAGIKGERNRMVAHPQAISNIGVMSKDIATQFDATYPKPRC